MIFFCPRREVKDGFYFKYFVTGSWMTLINSRLLLFLLLLLLGRLSFGLGLLVLLDQLVNLNRRMIRMKEDGKHDYRRSKKSRNRLL